MSALEDEKSYTLWIGRKATGLRRARLDCEHPSKGEVYYHLGCDRLSCSEECAEASHDCSAYAGVKSGTEEDAPEPAEDVSPVFGVPRGTSLWVSFADVAAGPFGGGNPAAVDLARRVQDGTAPVPDRVTEAARAEFLRQGLTEYEEGDVRWEYRDLPWRAWRIEALRPGGYRACQARLAPPVDAALQPDVTVMPADQFDELMTEEPRMIPALRRAWWKRRPW